MYYKAAKSNGVSEIIIRFLHSFSGKTLAGRNKICCYILKMEIKFHFIPFAYMQISQFIFNAELC